MSSSGQGAMEYLMSYGWAILVVTVVGTAMWQLGVLNIDQPTITMTGFQNLKPLLPTCRMGGQIWIPSVNYNGFTCQFANPYAQPIKVRNISIIIDGKACNWMIATVSQPWTSSYVYRPCGNANPNSCNSDPICYASNEYCITTEPGGSYLRFAANKEVVVVADTQESWHNSYPTEPCWAIERGRKYRVDVEITYDVTAGGETTRKTSSGTIMIPGE